ARLRPDMKAERVAKWIADLESDDFQTRDRATAELEKLADLAGPALRKALAAKPGAEAKARVGRLLAKLDGPDASGEWLRVVRALEALEHAGAVEAIVALKAVAAAAPMTKRAAEAKAGAERLAKRPAPKP